ncbi:MAG: site-specific integrase [Ruminococcus sp.]|nr:site-specific integrase [Ruminococcus sp.]
MLFEEEYKLHFQKHVDPTSTKFIDWLRLWLETYMRNSLKQSTYVSYKGYIENHIAPAFPNLKLKDLSVNLLQDFYNYKLTVQGLSPKTIANLNRCLHKAMKQAVLEHYIDFNPCDAVSLPRNENPQIEILTREEQQKLMYTSYNYRYGVFIRLTLVTGMRLGELLGLRWEDIDTKKSMSFQIGIADNDVIFTSDRPVIKTEPSKDELYNRPKAVIIPLTSKFVLFLFSTDNVEAIKASSFFKLSTEQIVSVQTYIAKFAREWIYSRYPLTPEQLEIIKKVRD